MRETKHMANETMNAHIRSESEMPRPRESWRVKISKLMTPARLQSRWMCFVCS